jgi:hypothetical protein
MNQSDLVALLDKKFSGEKAIMCPNQGKPAALVQSKITTSDHGRLAVHGSGTQLVCGICGYTQAVGAP